MALSRNVKQADWYGSHQSNALGENVGNVFYVAIGGNDANNGLTPATPFLTITHAMNQCTADNHDYIMVLTYNVAHAGEVWPIAMDVSKVHLIGNMSMASPDPLIAAAAGNTLEVAADIWDVEIAGIAFGADATSACISLAGTSWGTHIHHCDFGWSTGCQDGIVCADQPAHLSVHHCRFGADGVTRYGIQTVSNAQRPHISDNVFSCDDIAIYLAGANGGIVERNTFNCPDSANGEAITVGGVIGAHQAVFANNYAGSAATAMGNTPYRDLGGHAWALNYYDIRAIMPVTV